MDCNQAENNIIDYIYGELSPSDQRAFELHLQQCPQHAQELAKLKATLALVSKQPKPDMPEEWIRRILAQAEVKILPRPTIFRLVWNPVAATALVAVVMLTVGVAVVHNWKPIQKESLPEMEMRRDHPIEQSGAAEVASKLDESEEVAVVSSESDQIKPAKPEGKHKRSRPASVALKVKRKKLKKPSKPSGGVSLPSKMSSKRSKQDVPDTTGSGMRGLKSGEQESQAESFADYSAKPTALPVRPGSEAKGFAPSRGVSPLAPERLADNEPQRAGKAPSMEKAIERSQKERHGLQMPALKSSQMDTFQVAESHMVKKNTAQAISWYQRFLKEYPSDPRADTGRYRLAKALFMSGHCEDAVGAIRRAVARAPRHPLAGPALLDQASCLVRQNRIQEAADTYRRIQKEYPNYRQDARQGLRLIHSQLPAAGDSKSNRE